VVRCLAPALGLIVVLAPVTTLAQVNIDQDKSPAQLYAGDCAACHKSIRGLANGRSASALAGFLTEHYTASSREASAIAAYVLASGGAAAARAQPERERSHANAEEPRSREARRPVQPEGKPAANSAARKPEPERRAAVEPGESGSTHGPVPERHERGATRTRGRVKPEAVSPPPAPPPAAPAPEAKTAVATPPPAQPAAPAPQPSPAGTGEPKAAAPAQSGETGPVPRDNIPD
jgi:hypothetical protein